MLKIKEAIVVEGRYDKNTLSQIVDAPFWKPPALAFLRIGSKCLFCGRWLSAGA